MIGARLGEFEVVRLLKKAWMGDLYVAREHHTGALAAIKVQRASTPEAAARFEREARLATRLHHPHIVAGLAHGRVEEDTAWFAMELLAGEDLESRLKRSSLSVSEVITLGIQVCDALDHAHAAGVIHRDLKPSNLFLVEGATTHVKVLDFGVARLLDNRTTITRTNSPIGTLAYMSPEQARGERDLDPRSDLWSLGVVLYECLAGRRPFSAETPVGTLFQILEARPARLDALPAAVPAALADLVLRTIEKPRERRPASARALGEALRALSLSPGAPPPGQSSRPPSAPDDVRTSPQELHLAAVTLLRGARDPVFIETVAHDLQGHIQRLAGGDMLALFGLDRWVGDEPRRALRLALVTAHAVESVAVATGRCLTGSSEVLGGVIDLAAALVERGGVTVDATTAAFVRGDVALTHALDGTARIDPKTWRTTSPRVEVTYDTPFVGRSVELGVLLRSAENAWSEMRPAGVAVTGPEGIGKSRLCQAATEALSARASNAVFVPVRCDLFRRDVPFGVLRDAFAQAFDPSLGAIFDLAAQPENRGDPTAVIDRVRSSLATFLAGATERGPVVVTLDDAQWLDAASRATLRWLRESSTDLPLCLWVFGRPDARDLADLAGCPGVTELGPLEPTAAAELLRAITGDAPEAALDRAGGHPLFLEAIGRGLTHSPTTSTLPLTVESAWLAHLDRLPGPEREALKRASVFGRTFWFEGAEALGGESEALRRARTAGLIAPKSRSRITGAREMRFRAGALQEVAYQLLPDAQRAGLHGLAARWLNDRAGASPDELARHWEIAGDTARAAEEYARAAELAALAADVATACAHAERVLALSQDPTLRWRALAARDEALHLSDEVDLWSRGLDALDALARDLGLDHRVEVAWRRCYFARTRTGHGDASALGHQALTLADELGDPRWRATVRIDLAMIDADTGRIADARTHATNAHTFAERAGDAWLRARADATQGYVLGEAGEVERAVEHYERAAHGFTATGDRRREAIIRTNTGWLQLVLGRSAEAEGQTRAAIEAAERIGGLATVATCSLNLAMLRRMASDFDGAEQLLARAETLGAKLRYAKVTCTAAVERVYLAMAREDAGALRVLAERAVRAAEPTRSTALLASARAVALRVAARSGAVEMGAVDALRAMLALQQESERRAELRIALWEATTADPDRDAAREAVDVACAGDSSERAARVEAFDRRYLVPEALRGSTAPR